MEFHADTSRLIRILQKGHHGVQLGPEAWERLITWIDLNAPNHGTWSEFTRIPDNQEQRRCELRALYGGVESNSEAIVYGDPPFGGDMTPVSPPNTSPPNTRSTSPAVERRPEGATKRKYRHQHMEIELGDDVAIQLVQIPNGHSTSGVSIDRPIWMGCFEITNEQYAQIRPEHDSRFEHRSSWIFSEEYLGWPLDSPNQPVVRVSWNEANRFCRLLSDRSGRTIRLPTEQEWEYACRAGITTPFWFGPSQTDFSPHANLADRSLQRLATDSWGPRPPDLVARDDRVSDGHVVTATVGSFAPNPFGLYDMHGNVSEWTLGKYDALTTGRRAIRGGSWRDLPSDAHASARFGYQPFQKVFDVGFRVVCETNPPAPAGADPKEVDAAYQGAFDFLKRHLK